MKTPRTAKLPPFYTHVIGSLPRPKVVRDLLAGREGMDGDRFAAVMDEMVVFAIRVQERAGLDVVSDGEWRRVQYVDEFLDRLGGFRRSGRTSTRAKRNTTASSPAGSSRPSRSSRPTRGSWSHTPAG